MKTLIDSISHQLQSINKDDTLIFPELESL
jgi:hypothetical protein